MKKTATALLVSSMFAFGGMGATALAQTNGNNGNGNGNNGNWQNQSTQFQNQNQYQNQNQNRVQNQNRFQSQNQNQSRYNGMNGQNRYNNGYNPNLSHIYNNMNEQNRASGGSAVGTIQAVRTVQFNNGQRYVLTKIRDQQGNTMVLNLGTVQHLQQLNANLQQGSRITARGRGGRLNDEPILVVYTFRVSNGNNNSNNVSYTR